MELEWDEDKRQRNIRERGLDFADVGLFDPDTLRTVRDRHHDYGGVRYNSIGYLNDRLCTFCWTPRDGRIRVLSLRKANERERQKYEEAAARP